MHKVERAQYRNTHLNIYISCPCPYTLSSLTDARFRFIGISYTPDIVPYQVNSQQPLKRSNQRRSSEYVLRYTHTHTKEEEAKKWYRALLMIKR